MKTTMTMSRGEYSREVEVEAIPGSSEYSVYPFCITMAALEDLGFKFEAVLAKAA